jgi:OFA family oxalate/formate antiporter-like MFS transporter
MNSPVYFNTHKWNKFPLNPAKWPFFYGWFVMIAGALGIIMSVPGQTIGFSVFRDYVEADLGLSKVSLSVAYTIGTLLSGFLASYAGRLYDKLGARLMVPVASVLLGLALIYLTKTVDIVIRYSLLEQTFWNTFIKVSMLVVGLFTIRFCGQSILTMASRNMVMKWFDTRRGFANMFIGIFIAGGFSYAPRFFQELIDRYTWQNAWLYIALVSILFFSIFSVLFFRDDPQNYGLKPDGAFRSNNSKITKLLPKRSYTKAEAIRTPQFWIFNISLTMFAFYLTGFTFYVKDIFGVAGFTKEQAIAIFVPGAIFALTAEISGSLLSDYIKLKYFAIVILLGLLTTMFGALIIEQRVGFHLIYIGNGIAAGIFGLLSSVTWPRLFGVKHLGAISGYNVSWMVIGSALGPIYFSVLFELFGSYKPGITICLSMTLVLLIITLVIRNLNLNRQ